MPHIQQKSRARQRFLLDSQFVYIGVFSDDFAAVDVREGLCKTKPPEKANSEDYFNRTTIPKKSRVKNNTNLDLSFGSYYSGLVRRTGRALVPPRRRLRSAAARPLGADRPPDGLFPPRALLGFKSRPSSLLKKAPLPGAFWCEGRDLNPYGCPHAPQTCAYANSATAASARMIIPNSKGFVKRKNDKIRFFGILG